ncbi:MAG TPA: UDP-N-acetylmuramoyl-L-alanine--D-glutamate ligase [Vulgatibacter sp.]
MDVAGKKVLVVGLARSGAAAARLLRREGADVTVTDARSAEALADPVAALLPLGVRFELGGHDLAAFLSADLIVVSPGVPLAGAELTAAREARVPILGEAELASRFVREPVIAITGTNGKSTTTSLIGHLLESAGRRVFVGGNLGTPFCERVLDGGDLDFSVVELSSFQLEAVQTLRPHVAVLTNLTPDHLDRYSGPEAYYEAKRAIFRMQEEGDFAVVNAGDPKTLALHDGARSRRVTFASPALAASPGGESVAGTLADVGAVEASSGGSMRDGGAPYARSAVGAVDDGRALRVVGLPGMHGEEESYEELGRALRGRHNRENAMAAILAARLCGVSAEVIRGALPGFGGLPHRLELVRVRGGVEWLNDSKATNVDSAQVALAALPGRVVWIAGGLGKGAPYAPLRPLLPGRVKSILTIGADAPAIARDLGDLAPVESCGTLEEAVRVASRLTEAGDAVLLSPACASYDQFSSYVHRGETFRRLVEGLP